MAEMVACPNCERQLQIPESFLGQTVRCPECQHSFEANAASTAVQAAVPAPTAVSSRPRDDDDEDADQRPRRRRFEDDEEDDDYRPRRRYLTPHRGTMILTLGIMSIFIAPLILGTIAWIMGNTDLRAMREGQMDPDGESNTRTGRNIGMVMVCLYLAIIVLAVGFIGIMIATDNMH